MKSYSIHDLNGDSTVKNMRYEDGKAKCIFIDGDSENIYSIQVRTEMFFSENCSEEGSVSVAIYSLKDYIPVDKQSGRYIAPSDFGKQMNLYKKGLNLALGKKLSEYPYFFMISGYKVIFGCPIKSEEDINVTLIGKENKTNTFK